MFKKRIKKLGKMFVSLNQIEGVRFKKSALIVDNGYASLQHLSQALLKVKERILQGEVSILAFPHRREFLNRRFPDEKIIYPRESLIPRYQIANQMFKMRRNKYDHIVLLSLDITPIVVSLLLMNGEVVLYNRWHQLWTLKLKSIWDILFIPIRFLLNILIFFYLLIAASLIFLKRAINVLRLPRASKK